MALTTRVDLLVPYVEKEDAKALGARWDKDRKVWFAPPGVDPSTLGRWLPKGFTPPTAEEPTSPSEPERGTALIDLLAQVREAIEQGLPDTVWVRAEVSELRGQERPRVPEPRRAERAGRRARPGQGRHLEEPGRRHRRQVRAGHRRGAQDRHQDPLPGQGPLRRALRPRPHHRGRGPLLHPGRPRRQAGPHPGAAPAGRPLRPEQGPARPRGVRPGRRHQPVHLGGPGRLPPGDRPAPARRALRLPLLQRHLPGDRGPLVDPHRRQRGPRRPPPAALRRPGRHPGRRLGDRPGLAQRPGAGTACCAARPSRSSPASATSGTARSSTRSPTAASTPRPRSPCTSPPRSRTTPWPPWRTSTASRPRWAASSPESGRRWRPRPIASRLASGRRSTGRRTTSGATWP